MLLGPAGAMLYRLALFFRGQWGGEIWPLRRDGVKGLPPSTGCRCAARPRPSPWSAISRTPCIAGGPRRQAGPTQLRYILASGAGAAIGVRLGQPVQEAGEVRFSERPELGSGEEADADFMQSAIGLVWRSLVLCVLLLALFWVASWVG